MKLRTAFSLCMCCLAVGCATVPPEVVTGQEMVVEGIEIARRNQLTLINAYADDQKAAVERTMKGQVLDNVLQRELKGRPAFPPNEVKSLIMEFSEDLGTKTGEVEARRRELLKMANEGFDELVELAKRNLTYARSMRAVTERDEALRAQLKARVPDKLNDLQDKIQQFLKR